MPDHDDNALPTGRIGGQASGGIDPRPGDPDTPRAARARNRKSADDHAAAGFGDDKGSDAG